MKARIYHTAAEMRAIVRSAKDKASQILILADLNECSIDEVVDVVRDNCNLTESEKSNLGRFAAIERLWQQGKNDAEIACALGLTERIVNNWRSVNGRTAVGEQRTRTCRKCGATYPATTDFFHKAGHGRHGLQAECKSCISKRYRERKARTQA